MRVKEAVTKVNMRTVREAREKKEVKRVTSDTSLLPRPRAPTRASLRCSYLLLEIPTEGACEGGYFSGSLYYGEMGS